MTCACGHVQDEHEPECTIEGCDCVHYEWNGENEE